MKTAFAFEKAVPLTNDDLSFHSYCFSSRHLPPPSLWAHLNNYYNPEECKLRGTHSGEKLGPWITHLHFPPSGIQTFILWSHPSFRDSNNEPLLHCIAILAILANKLAAVSFKTTAKQVNIDILLFPPTFLNFPRSQYNVDTMTAVRIKHEDHDDCDVTWSPGSSDDHPPTDRKSLGSNWWALIISGDTDRGHLEPRKYSGEGHFWGHWKVLTPQFSVNVYPVQNK